MPGSNGFGAITSLSASLPMVRFKGKRGSGQDLLMTDAVVRAPSEMSLQESTIDHRPSSTCDSSLDGSPAIAPPKKGRPQSSNPRRFRTMFNSSPPFTPTSSSSTARVSTADSGFEGFTPIASQALLSKADLAAAAPAEGWFVTCPHEDQHGLSPESAPSGVEANIVMHERGHDAATTKAVRSLVQAGDLGPPVFVLLLGASGATQEDFDFATALQREFCAAGAEDVLCNTRTLQELRLAVAMALHRRASKIDAMSRMRASFAREAERSGAEKLKELEETQATGLFWQSVDRLFKEFPAMDAGLPREFAVGTRVGSYKLDSTLGSGAYGKVYGAASERSGKREAMKVIAKSSIKRCRHATALHREVDLHGRLDHHHIVRFLGMMHGPLHVILRMEEASQSNLFFMMQSVSGSLMLHDTKRFHAQLSSAVAHCHARGVAHRDLKPENVALDASGLDIKLVDFGCSARANCLRTDVVGSLPFMAPEVFIAAEASPYRAANVDIWACGVILVEMLLGAHHLSRRLGWDRTERPSPKRHGELVQYFSDESAVRKLLRRRFGDDDMTDLEELLRGMFEVVPSERWSAQRVAESKWPIAS